MTNELQGIEESTKAEIDLDSVETALKKDANRKAAGRDSWIL